MRLIALEIPDQASDLAAWLEGHLAGTDLAALVAELEAVHGRGGGLPPVALDTVLGSERDAVLARGLALLPPEPTGQLLRHPRLLLDLQELILREGGAYWHKRAESVLERGWSAEQRTGVDRGWDWLKANVIEAAGPARSDPAGLVQTALKEARPRSRRRWGSLALVSLAAAAAVVLAIVVLPFGDRRRQGADGAKVTSSGWGWDRPDAFPQGLGSRAYLEHLADGAHEWFNKRPDDAASLARRITEFRQGCTVLI
jgi:hypothetical protein